MTYPINQRELTVHLNNGHWYIRPVEEAGVLGPIDYGWRRFNLYPDSFTFGEGLLAGSSVPGTRRLFFSAWSPQWDGFYVSSMGGAAYTFHGLGVPFVALRGQAQEPSVLILNHKDGEVDVRLEPVNVEPTWACYADPQGNDLIGVYALQQLIFDRYGKEFTEGHARVFAVGPAAKVTQEGAIGSSPVRKGKISAVVDWAGRGGLGSRLYQAHNIVGCIFGGDWEDPDLRDSKEIDLYFMEQFGKRTMQVDLAVTEKYRYYPEFETGGTFGVNMSELNERLLSYNYTSIYAPVEERRKLHEDFIKKHYLKQFNEETIQTKDFAHCGEPCPVACKKMRDQYKKDYEPYEGLGPQVGVFDQRAAEALNDYVDAMGFDAIQTGGMLAWIMDLATEGLINPVEYGFPAAEGLKFQFTADQAAFDIVEDSLRNAQYAMGVVDAILFDERCEIFRQGIRYAARELDKANGTHTADRAVYLAHGEEGYMAPNYYWAPGVLSSMPIMGKYYMYYGSEFREPYALGRKNVERMVYEFFSDNSGICRFHRKWAEVIVDEILCAHYGLDVDYLAHQFELAKAIYEREKAKAMPWESERLADLTMQFLRQWQQEGVKNAALDAWVQRFEQDKREAGRAFWDEIQRGIADAFAAGPEGLGK